MVPAPVSGYGVTLFWVSRLLLKTLHFLHYLLHFLPPAKAERGTVQL